MSTPVSTSTEAQVIADISTRHMQAHLEVFSTLFRDSGTEDEWKAARYVAEKLTEYGVDSEILEFDSLISWPQEGKIELLDADGNVTGSIPCRTRAFGAQTPDGGITGELVFVPFAQPAKGEMIFSHRAVAGDYSNIDVTGKFVLTADGGPDGIRRAHERGAAAHIHIWPSDEAVIHEMIGTSVWGTPTPESATRIPAIPAMGVDNANGQELETRLMTGSVRACIESNVSTEWRRVPLVTGFIPGTESDDYLIVGGHIDSWYEGITDNATGDVAILEMARILGPHRDQLRRGIRFTWWPGHSTGRYSGSTWFADTQFDELRAHCIGYLNIDSPGVRGATEWDCRYNMGEIEHITAAAVTEKTGQDPAIRRPLKAADMSFLGIGFPTLGAYPMLPVDHPDRKAVGGCGGAYWWHSPKDTLDKADVDLLARDVGIYTTMTLRMVTPEVIPYIFVPSANDFLTELTALQEKAGQYLNLTQTLALAERFEEAAAALATSTPSASATRNMGLKRISQVVNPALFTIAGPYEFDPALQLPILPGLAPMERLSALHPESSEHRFLLTSLIRQRNRIGDALLRACEIAESLVNG